MFCRNCGQEVAQETGFCTNCGSPLDPAQANTAQQEAFYQPPMQATPAQQPQAKKPKKKLIIGVIVAAVVLAIVAVAGVLIWQHVQKAQEPITLRTKMIVANANISETSGVPLNIKGYDLDNNEVNEDILITAEDQSIDLVRGDYTITVAGTPVSNSGYLYTSETIEIPVQINDVHTSINDQVYSQIPDSNSDAPLELSIDFSSIAPEDVTDEMLAEARQWMTQFGIDQTKIDDYINTATQLRQSELDRINAEKLRKAAFGNFPADFSFSSGVGAWGAVMTIQPDGSFTESYHDVDAGDSGPGYSGTIYLEEFSGSFTVVEQVNSTTFKLQLNELQSTHKAETTINSDGMREIYSGTDSGGLGKATNSPVQGYTLYLPGSSRSAIGTFMQSDLNSGSATIDFMVIVTPNGSTWVSR